MYECNRPLAFTLSYTPYMNLCVHVYVCMCAPAPSALHSRRPVAATRAAVAAAHRVAAPNFAVPPHVAVPYPISVSQRVAVRCSALQCVAVCARACCNMCAHTHIKFPYTNTHLLGSDSDTPHTHKNITRHDAHTHSHTHTRIHMNIHLFGSD